MLIPLLAVSGLSSGSRRPLTPRSARDDHRPGGVPPPMAAQETRARGGCRTAPRWRDHLWSYAPRHALTGGVRRPSALMARVPACPHGSPWPESRPRAGAACGAGSTRRGTLRPRGGCHAHGHRLWCGRDRRPRRCPTRAAPGTARAALSRDTGDEPQTRRGLARPARARDAGVSLTLTWP